MDLGLWVLVVEFGYGFGALSLSPLPRVNLAGVRCYDVLVVWCVGDMGFGDGVWGFGRDGVGQVDLRDEPTTVRAKTMTSTMASKGPKCVGVTAKLFFSGVFVWESAVATMTMHVSLTRGERRGFRVWSTNAFKISIFGHGQIVGEPKQICSFSYNF